MDISIILTHIVITLIVLFVSLILGGGLGLVAGLGLRALYRAVPALYRPFMLIPWRTAMLGLLIFLCSPFVHLALNMRVTPSQIEPLNIVFVSTTFILIVFVSTIVVLLAHWIQDPLAVRVLTVARMIAVISSGYIAYIGMINSWGILHQARLDRASTFQLDSFWIALAGILGLALAFDLLFGVAQMVTAYFIRKSETSS